MLALKAISRGEASSQTALAERLLVDAPAVSRLVDRLVEDGLLKRCAGDDRRCVRLEVTAGGQKELGGLLTELQWLEDEMSKHLTAQEARTLGQLLEKLRAGLAQVVEADEKERTE